MVFSFLETERALGENVVIPSAATVTLLEIARVFWGGAGEGLAFAIEGNLGFVIHPRIHQLSCIHQLDDVHNCSFS